jgi:hypothetical protein
VSIFGSSGAAPAPAPGAPSHDLFGGIDFGGGSGSMGSLGSPQATQPAKPSTSQVASPTQQQNPQDDLLGLF